MALACAGGTRDGGGGGGEVGGADDAQASGGKTGSTSALGEPCATSASPARRAALVKACLVCACDGQIMQVEPQSGGASRAAQRKVQLRWCPNGKIEHSLRPHPSSVLAAAAATPGTAGLCATLQLLRGAQGFAAVRLSLIHI